MRFPKLSARAQDLAKMSLDMLGGLQEVRVLGADNQVIAELSRVTTAFLVERRIQVLDAFERIAEKSDAVEEALAAAPVQPNFAIAAGMINSFIKILYVRACVPGVTREKLLSLRVATRYAIFPEVWFEQVPTGVRVLVPEAWTNLESPEQGGE
jgi:hypothetical protein